MWQWTFMLYRVARSRLTFKIWILCRRDSLSWLSGRGTVEERTPFHMVSHNVALECATTCLLPVFVVSVTSLGLLGRPNLLYQILSCGGSWKTVCSGGVSWLFKNSNKPLLTKLQLLMRTYGGACMATSRHATVHWCKQRPSAWCSENELVICR